MTGPSIVTPDDAEYRAWLAKQQQAAPTHDDAEFQAWKAQQKQPPSSTHPATTAPGQNSTLYNVLNTIDHAVVPFGIGQRINAAYDAAGDAISGRDSFGHAYTQRLDQQHAGLNQFQQQHPYIAAGINGLGTGAQIVAGNAAGLIKEAPATAETIADAATTGGRMLQAGKTGAKMGAAFGATSALGDAPNRGGIGSQLATAAKGGAEGAAFGGLVGAGSVPAAQIISAAIDRMQSGKGFVGRVLASDNASGPAATRVTPRAAEQAGGSAPVAQPTVDRASGLLIKQLGRAGLTPADAIDVAARIPDSKPVSVIELADDRSQPLRELGKWVARSNSTGAADIRATVAERAKPVPVAQRVLGDVADALGQPRQNLTQYGKTLREQQIANAQPHYDAAFSGDPVIQPDASVDGGPTLSDLLKRPSMKDAIKSYNRNALERGEKPLQLFQPAQPQAEQRVPPGFDLEQWKQAAKSMEERGIPVPKEFALVPDAAEPEANPVSLKALQRLKFQLDEDLGFAETYGRLPNGTPATNEALGPINQTRVDLLNLMNGHSAAFEKANEIWGGDAAMQQALKKGQGFLSRPISELQAEYPTMTPAEQQQHNIGAVSGPLRDQLYTGQPTDRAKIIGSPNWQERLEVVAPADRLATLNRNAGIEHQIALTNQQMSNGSDTFTNLQNEAEFGGADKVRGFLTSLLGSHPRYALRRAVGSLVQAPIDRYVHGINEETANALAPQLTAGMTGSRDELVKMLQELAVKYQMLQQLRSGLAPQIGAAAGISAGQLPSGR